MARTVKKVADTQAIQKLEVYSNDIIDLRPIIAYTMRKSDCTFTEIAEVFNISRQFAKTIVDELEADL